MLMYINKKLIEFKEDYIDEIHIKYQDSDQIQYVLTKESKGYLFRDLDGNSYNPHFHTIGMAINNAICNEEEVYQGKKIIPCVITQINAKFFKE